MDLCKHKDILGKPYEGFHSYRFLDIAIADVALTVAGAGTISYVYKVPFRYTSISLFSLGIVLHRMFCVRTTIDKILFP